MKRWMALAFGRQSHGKKKILQQQRNANRINNRKFSLMVLFAPWPAKIVFLTFPDKFIDGCGRRIKKLAGNRLPPRKKGFQTFPRRAYLFVRSQPFALSIWDYNIDLLWDAALQNAATTM